MAKKTKDTAAGDTKAAKAEAKAKAKAKPKAPLDPVKTRNLIRLINILALLLAITAFLLQLFAVISHHWKWQSTSLRPIISPTYHYAQPNVHDDSRLNQIYGLFSRDVKVYANNDEQLDTWTSTRFPRADEGEGPFHQCLSQTSTLRGAFLTCSRRVVSSDQCHCRRYAYWNAVIVFEILALILLGLVVFLTALLTTQFQALLKLAGAGLSILAFIFLLIGLILILSHLKRETRSLADAYPHIHRRLSDKINVNHDEYRAVQRNPTVLHQAVRRQVHETYRAYSLLPGQHPYNDTHFQQYSEQQRAWVHIPYSSVVQPVRYAPLQQRGPEASAVDRRRYSTTSKPETTSTPIYNQYGPVLGYDTVFDNTRAGIGWSTILSILALILSLLVPLLLVFSWLTGKKLGSDTKTVTTTTVKTEYVALPQEVVETVPTRAIPSDYDPRRPVGDAIVTTQNVRHEPVIVHDVVIRDDRPVSQTTQEHAFPANVESTQKTSRS